MSKFLGFESHLVPINASPSDFHVLLRQLFVNQPTDTIPGYGWTLVAENLTGVVQSISVPSTFVICPPSSELIGSAYVREVVFINIYTDHMAIFCGQQALQDYPQRFQLNQGSPDYPSSPNAVTINGHTVSQSDPNFRTKTAVTNLINFYADLRNSVDPEISNWIWTLSRPPAQNANDGNYFIYGTRGVAAPDVTVSAVNMGYISTPRSTTDANIKGNGGYFNHAVNYPGVSFGQGLVTYTQEVSMPIDLVSGFVYYAQICARGFAIGIKTNSGYFGPVHAAYGDHATALAALPEGFAAYDISPIELMIGTDGSGTDPRAYAEVSHYWSLNYLTRWAWSSNTDDGYYTVGYHPFNSFAHRDTLQDASHLLRNNSSVDGQNIYLTASNIWGGGATGAEDDFQIHRMAQPNIYNTSWYNADWILPPIALTDWYHFVGSVNNESLVVIADTVTQFALVTPLDSLTNTGQITITGSQAPAASGAIVLDAEIIQYTSVVTNT